MTLTPHAVILAAGRGSRLAGAANSAPKCLAPVGGSTLLEHNVMTLRSLGVERITVVLGHHAPLVRDRLGWNCEYLENTRFAETNSLYSLWLARDVVRSPFILMNCDVLAHRDIFRRLLEVDGSALAFDSSSGDDDEHMKVEVADGRLRSIAKDLPSERTSGENVGILRFGAEDARILFDRADALVGAGKENVWAPAAVGELARHRPIRCVDVAGLPWVEIDFPDDLVRADRTVWPRIRAHASSQSKVSPRRTA